MARKPKKAQSAEADLTPTDEAVHTAPLEISPTTTEDNNTVHHETFETPAIPTQTLVIAGLSFSVKAPYAEGHVATAGEAAALNQTLAENLRNNFAKKVKEVKGENATVSDEVKAKLDEELALYEATYSFDKVRAVRAPRQTFVDPVEREAFKSASAFVEAALNAKGLSKKALKPENFKQLVLDVLVKRPEIREAARRHVEALNAVAHDAIAGLQDAEIELREAEEEPEVTEEEPEVTDLSDDASFE